MTVLTTLLLLADGRFPAGGHAHSGGLEAAVGAGRVRDLADLESFLRGRLATSGLVAAAFAARACMSIVDLEVAFDARTPSPALRATSRRQGRALLRAGLAIWPSPELAVHREGLHQPIALGLVAAAASLAPPDAALVAAYTTVTGPASAAVRLLGLDPFAVQRLLTALAGDCDRIAGIGAGYAGAPAAELPAAAAPLLDIGAEAHARWEVRLFAS
jgi:urease accessory protein